MKLMPSSSTAFRIVSACQSVTGRPPQIRDPRISMAPKLNRVTFRPVRPKTEVVNASDTIHLLDLYELLLIDIIRKIVLGDDRTNNMPESAPREIECTGLEVGSVKVAFSPGFQVYA